MEAGLIFWGGNFEITYMQRQDVSVHIVLDIFIRFKWKIYNINTICQIQYTIQKNLFQQLHVHVQRKMINSLHGLTEYAIKIHASAPRIVVL